MTAFYNDIEGYACRVLRKQIGLGNLPQGDVDERSISTIDAAELRSYSQIHLFAGIGGIPYGLRLAGVPDDFNIITGGFPCQDISVAGTGAGIEGSRSGLWREYARLIRALRPSYVLVENVSALTNRGLSVVLGDLAACGYVAEWQCIPASAVGAPHQRDRLWIVAYPDSPEWRAQCERDRSHGENARWQKETSRFAIHGADGGKGHVAYAERDGRQQGTQVFCRRESFIALCSEISRGWWDAEPAVGRVAHGIPARVDRLRGLGNAVVPQVVQLIGMFILEHANKLYHLRDHDRKLEG